MRKWRLENKEQSIQTINKYKKIHNKNCKKWRDENKTHLKKYRLMRKEKDKQYHVKYYIINKKRLQTEQRIYRKNNPDVFLKGNLKYLRNQGKQFKKKTYEYMFTFNQWSKSIKKRDIKCQICGSKENLNAHHILHRKYYPKLSFNINNGITLCTIHHKEVHQYLLV